MRMIGIAVALAAAFGMAGQVLAGAERITYPDNYKSDFVYFMTSDRPDNNTVRDLYANLTAFESARDGAPLDHGSQFAMEVYAAVVDEAGGARVRRRRPHAEGQPQGRRHHGEAAGLGGELPGGHPER